MSSRVAHSGLYLTNAISPWSSPHFTSAPPTVLVLSSSELIHLWVRKESVTSQKRCVGCSTRTKKLQDAGCGSELAYALMKTGAPSMSNPKSDWVTFYWTNFARSSKSESKLLTTKQGIRGRKESDGQRNDGLGVLACSESLSYPFHHINVGTWDNKHGVDIWTAASILSVSRRRISYLCRRTDTKHYGAFIDSISFSRLYHYIIATMAARLTSQSQWTTPSE